MVVGVLPSGFRIPAMPRTDVVVPQALPAVAPAQRRSGGSTASDVSVHGETLARAQAELAALSRQFEVEFPQQNRGSRYEVLALRDALVGDTRRPLLLLLAAVGLRPADRVRERRQPAAGPRAWTAAGARASACARRQPPPSRRAAADGRARARLLPAAWPASSSPGVWRPHWPR